jgi:hypothetical protein
LFTHTMQQEENFDPVQAERNEINTLTQRGVSFSVECKSLISKIFRRKERKFLIQQPYLGTLDYLAAEYIQMRYDEEAIKEDWIAEGKRMMKSDAKRCARVVAIAVLNDRWKLKYLIPFFATYFLWRITPEKLSQLTSIILQTSNIVDFIGSIRYLSIKERMTAPNLVEGTSQEQDDQEHQD